MNFLRLIGLIAFLFACRAEAQVITLLSVDESKSDLRIQGVFGASGSVTIDDTLIEPTTWTDSLITVQIPRGGRGSFGLVKVMGAAIDSAWLTKWILPIEIDWQYLQRGGVSEDERLTASPEIRFDIYNARRLHQDVAINSNAASTHLWYQKYDNGNRAYHDTSFAFGYHGFGGSSDLMSLYTPPMLKCFCSSSGITIAFDSAYRMQVLSKDWSNMYGGGCRIISSVAEPMAPPPFIAPQVLSVDNKQEDSAPPHLSIVYDLLGREIARYYEDALPQLKAGAYLIKRGNTITKVVR